MRGIPNGFAGRRARSATEAWDAVSEPPPVTTIARRSSKTATPPAPSHLERAADELRQQEFARLSDAAPPATLEAATLPGK